ncbi:MAG: hypothetical protein KY461_01085 [Actinobacteria bacterium]|nr:hypothetical protein [Actinomycetota bacterium]
MGIVIGCDIGTQSVKGVAMDEDGRIVGEASVAYGTRFPQEAHAEQDLDTWRLATVDVLADLGRQVGARRPEVSHVAIDAQVDGIVGVSADLSPRTPALIWLDRRAVSERARLEEAVGSRRIAELTGLNPDSSHGAPKIMWLRSRHGADVRWWLSPCSAVVAGLTGEVVQDHANASSTMLYDVRRREWAAEMLAAADIEPASLAEIREATDTAGVLRSDIAAATGLPAGCAVLVGTGDDHAAAVSAGGTRPGVVVDITGTAEPVGVSCASPVFDPERLVETHAHAVAGAWFFQHPGIVSGGSVLWIAEVLAVDQSAVFTLAADAPPASRGLLFLPALCGSMSPRWNECARGALTGASMNHKRPEIARAVLEGCTFALRDILDRIQALTGNVHELRATGGGARSDLWLQMKSDITGRVVRRVAGAGPAAGAACLAAVAAGWFSDIPEASDELVVLETRSFDPDPAAAAVYEDAYGRYRDMFDALEPTFASGGSERR